MAKQVSEILVKLGIENLAGLEKLKSSFRGLSQTINQSDRVLSKARKDIIAYGEGAQQSEALAKGMISALEGLKSQASFNSTIFKQLTKDIASYSTILRGSSDAQEMQRDSLLKMGAAAKNSASQLQTVVNGLKNLRTEVRPGSSAFVQLGRDIDSLQARLRGINQESKEFRKVLGQTLSVDPAKASYQIESLNRELANANATAESLATALRKLELLNVGAGRERPLFRFDVFSSQEGITYFERLKQSYQDLPKTTAIISQRISEVNTELENVTGYTRRRELTLELIRLNKELKQAVVDVTTAEEFAVMAARQRIQARRTATGETGFGAFSREVTQRTAAGVYTGGGQKAAGAAEALKGVRESFNTLDDAFNTIESASQKHQITLAEIEAKGQRLRDEQLDVAAQQRLSAEQEAFKRELALFEAQLDQRDSLLQRKTAAKGALGLSGRELSSFYEGVVGIGTRRAAAEQSLMGRTPQQAFADIVNTFNSDLDQAGNGFLESERQLREAAIEFAGGSKEVRKRFEQIALGKTPAGMFPSAGESPDVYRARIEGGVGGIREIIAKFARKTDRAGDGFLEAEKQLRQAAIDFASGSADVKRAFAQVPLGKTPTSMLPSGSESSAEYIQRLRGGFADVELPDFVSLRKGTTRELQQVRESLQELRLDLNPLAASFESTEKRIVKSIKNIDKELEKRQTGRRRMTGMQMTQAAGAALSGGIFGGPEGFLGGAIGSAFGVGGAFAGAAIGAQVGGLRQQLGGFADYAAQIQKMQIALENAAGSQSEFNRAMAAAASATQNLNVPQDVAIQGMTKLTAAVKGAGGQVSDAELVFRNVSSAIKATGGSAQDVDGAITAMVQVFSKGKVSAEELSGQLGERLPGAVTKFAKANDMTLPELQKALEQGQVGLNELMNFIVALGGEYAGVAEKIAASSQDAGARLTVAFNEMKIAVGEALQPIGAQFQEAFIPFIKNIAPVLTATLPAIGNLALGLAKNIDVLAASLAALATGAIVNAIVQTGGLVTAFKALTTAVAASNAVLLLNPWVALAAGIAAATVALIKHNQAQQEYNNLLDNGAGSTDELRLKQRELEADITAARKALEGSADGMGATGRRAMQLKMKIADLENQLARINKTFTIRLKLEREGFSFDEEGMMKEFTVAGIVYGGPKGARAVPLRRVDGTPLNGRTQFENLAGTDNGGAGKSSADKAAKEEQRIQERLKALALETQGIIKQAIFRGKIAEAEIRGNKEQAIRLRGEARAQQISEELEKSLIGITDKRVKQALLAKSQAEIEFAGIETAIELEQQRLAVIKEQNNEIFRRAGLTPQDKMRSGAGAFDPSLPDLRVSPAEQQMAAYRAELDALTNPINMAVTGANAIGSAFGQAFQDIATGAKTTQEALADAFQNIGQAFVSMAAEIIAKQLAMIAFQTILKALGGGGGGLFSGAGPVQMPTGAGFAEGFTSLLPGRANGGPVAGNQPYMVGERGPELFVPNSSGTVMSSAETRDAIARQAGNRQTNETRTALDKQTLARQTNETRAALSRQLDNRRSNAMTETMQAKPLEVKYESTVINRTEYVSAEQHRKGMAEAAERGRALTLAALQNSVKARRKVGI